MDMASDKPHSESSAGHGRWTLAASDLFLAGLLWLCVSVFEPGVRASEIGPLRLEWSNEMLTMRAPNLYGGAVRVHYLEAFCRPGSTRRAWKDTVIPHRTRLIEATADGRLIRLQSVLDGGVRVDHQIRAEEDAVDFRLTATNPGTTDSQAQWAQPCIRVDAFTGVRPEPNSEAYLPKCFVFMDGKLSRLPTQPWVQQALYTPGQVWCPELVSRNDVNPRPLSALVPSNGLIGCFSGDGKQIMATAWEPYQELFQGVIVCLHSDFRIGGLKPGETKTIRGKIYLVPGDVDALLARYRSDFPEHHRSAHVATGPNRPRKLIEFGWDEPDLEFVLRNREVMSRSPFDGCVFHVNTSVPAKKVESLTWLGWGRREFKSEEFPAAQEALAEANHANQDRIKGFNHHFLRFNVTPANLDWFDDYGAVVANARLAAELARRARCDGVLLDTEQYEGPLFDFSKQRDAKRRSWMEYALQARRRGKEVMSALQSGFPDLTVMLTFGPSWLCPRRAAPDVEVVHPRMQRYGLLVPFVDGMIDAAKGKTRIVDGFEASYGYREAMDFEKAHELITRTAAPQMANPSAYRRLISAGFGLWLDYDWRQRGWKTETPEANYFSPERFEKALSSALRWADEYVWIYTEKPRWWTSDGKRVELPEAYVRSIRQARVQSGLP